MTGIDNPAISKGSTVLVSGVNGYLGSNVADQFLRFGYKVRGTVRDAEKNAWVADLFQGEFGKDAFELVAVPDMAAEGAFSEAVKGSFCTMKIPGYQFSYQSRGLCCCPHSLCHED